MSARVSLHPCRDTLHGQYARDLSPCCTIDSGDVMVRLVMQRYNLSRKLALGMVSVTADVRVTQLVNGLRGAHVLLPTGAIS